jgi:uncharacterized repeat protein (TIGR01451 family)
MTARPSAITPVNLVGLACALLHTGLEGGDRILAALQKTSDRMMIHKAFGFALALLAAALPAQAQTPAKDPVDARLEVHKVVRAADGRESVSAADAVKPGDVLEYVVTYRNNGARPVRDLAATLPIPPATELISGSEKPAGARGSVDAREFNAVPLKRKVRRDGREMDEAVPFREYRALRWQTPELKAGQTVTFSARVRVLE